MFILKVLIFRPYSGVYKVYSKLYTQGLLLEVLKGPYWCHIACKTSPCPFFYVLSLENPHFFLNKGYRNYTGIKVFVWQTAEPGLILTQHMDSLLLLGTTSSTVWIYPVWNRYGPNSEFRVIVVMMGILGLLPVMCSLEIDTWQFESWV